MLRILLKKNKQNSNEKVKIIEAHNEQQTWDDFFALYSSLQNSNCDLINQIQ